jgi:hypothetical protein
LPTAQKPQWRVQMSPPSMKVAVRSDQHSKMFGQRASWQTVCRFKPSIKLQDVVLIRRVADANLQPVGLAPRRSAVAGGTGLLLMTFNSRLN